MYVRELILINWYVGLSYGTDIKKFPVGLYYNGQTVQNNMEV